MVTRAAVLAAACIASAAARQFHVYVGNVTPTSVLVAWGTTSAGGNSIGRGARSYGDAELRVGKAVARTRRSWAEVTGLQPNTVYDYQVVINGRAIGGGSVRTWEEQATRMAFLVMGDYGNGSARQYRVADAMWKRFQERASTGNPVRFVLTTGDNIYADASMFYMVFRSGEYDRDWERKFFGPYAKLIAHVPVFPTLGNHDGNASENRADLAAYLDNFFFPYNKAARWYEFSYGGLADFFGLDSTDNTEQGRSAPVYGRDSEQFAWMRRAFAASRAPWKIPYFHHPPFNAGPGYGASLAELLHWVELFEKSGVKVAFSGHEHNFQFSARDAATRNMLFVVSGAGGELRTGNVMGGMAAAHIAGWSPQRHFLDVEIDGRAMRITPLSYEPVSVRDGNGKIVSMPLVVTLPD